MSSRPLLIDDCNISNAWCKALQAISKAPNKEITPLIVSLSGFEENQAVRLALDESLKANKKASVDTVSETIFPNSLYHFYANDRHILYREYLNILPRIRKIDVKNRRGTYFERLIAFDKNTNQLERIIKDLQQDSSVRRSKLQASIFDPVRDYFNSPYQGFPCLQHITFYQTKDSGLIVNSFYAIQYLYERAYGNWVGLINLGKFMDGAECGSCRRHR
jgi:hypothetical protein